MINFYEHVQLCVHLFPRVCPCVLYTRNTLSRRADVNGSCPGTPRRLLTNTYDYAWNLRLYRRQRSIINSGAIKPWLRRNFPFQRVNETEKRVAARLCVFSHLDVCYRKRDLSPFASAFPMMFQNLFCFYSGDSKIFMPNSAHSLLVQKKSHIIVLHA